MTRLAHSLSSLIAVLLAAASCTSGASGYEITSFKGTPPLVVSGYRFFDSSTGAYFGVRGVNYYPRPNTGAFDTNNLDLFTNSPEHEHLRTRDFPMFEKLNANTIRLYAVDPNVDHSAFMCELQALGMYVIVDLGSSCVGCEITPVAPPACYPKSYKDRGEKIIREFARYDNVMAFSGGNEVNHRSAGHGPDSNAPCQKMFIRDMRNFIAAHAKVGMRQVPVGLVTADSERDDNALYYNCESSSLSYERAEWYGLNTYIQCDDIADATKAAGFNNLRDSFIKYKYSIPVILTEFGCTSDRFPSAVDAESGRTYDGQRTFHDALWMNTPDYTEHFNGGCVFEYSTENANSKSTSAFPFTKFGPQNYGLGYLYPETCDDVTVPCQYKPMPNFHSLAGAYKQTNTSSEPTLSTFTPAPDRTAPSKCPASYRSIGEFTWAGGLDPLNTFTSNDVKRVQCPTTNDGLTALKNGKAMTLSANTGVLQTPTVAATGDAKNASVGCLA